MQILLVRKVPSIKIRGSHLGYLIILTIRFKWARKCLTRGMQRFSSSSRGSQRVSCLIIMTMASQWCRVGRNIIITISAIQVLVYWNRYRNSKLIWLLLRMLRKMRRIYQSLMNKEEYNNRKTFKKSQTKTTWNRT